MKLGRLSLVAAFAIATGLHANSAVDTVKKATDSMKFDAQLKLWYQTQDRDGSNDKGLFQRDPAVPNEWGNVSALIGVSGDANDHIKYRVSAMAVTTFGLDSVATTGQTADKSHPKGSHGYDEQPFWIHEVYIDYLLTNKTNVKIGRMELNTPLIYTEKWNATANSFEAITAINSDLPSTSLTAAWIAKGNGTSDQFNSNPQVYGSESRFYDFMGYKKANGEKLANAGVLALGGLNNSLSFMPLQGWYYFSPDSVQAFWLQADPSIKELGPIDKVGMQIIGAGIGTNGNISDYIKSGSGGAAGSAGNTDTKMTQSIAAKIALDVGIFNTYAAYSSNSKGNLPVANMATNYKKTKLPTASIFNDGMVAAQPDTQAWKIGAGAKFEGIGSLGLSYGSYSVGKNSGYFNPTGDLSMGAIAQINDKDIDVNEIDVVFKTTVKDVDLAAMYIHVDKTYVDKKGEYANDIVRLVATLKF